MKFFGQVMLLITSEGENREIGGEVEWVHLPGAGLALEYIRPPCTHGGCSLLFDSFFHCNWGNWAINVLAGL